ncbi:MAG: DNA polymerase III subunit delta' [Nitrospiraceae bacterium]|nr:MAG: DNA polymerase III subunit delta' [Nitrospiraceae bacterium]
MALKDIIGQERAIGILRGCIAKNRVPHALLFAGDEGIGKRLTAMNFAKALNCRGPASGPPDTMSASLFEETFPEAFAPETSAPLDACDACPSCTKMERGNHPDLFIIAPEGEGRQVTVSAIRQLEEALSYKPFEGAWKIAIIDDAEKMNQSAANAFLQTLEEPASRSVLILISSRPDMILPTIRSRCQRVSFSPLPLDTMSRLLQERFGHGESTEARLLSVLSAGRLGYALGDDLIAQRDRHITLFSSMTADLDNEVWEDREDMESWFDWSQLVLRDIAVYAATGRTDILVNHDRVETIKALSQGAELRAILKLARDLYNIKSRLLFNLNKQLTQNYVKLLLRKCLGRGA